jgi:SH3 domain protein
MKKLLLAGLILVGFASVCSAQAMYVNDVKNITMRTGPGNENQIVAMINSGEQLELLKEQGDWALVRKGEGMEGWVISRFLTREKPAKIVLKELTEKYDALVEKAKILEEENIRIKTELEENIRKLTEITALYETLKAGSAEFISVKGELEKASKALGEVQSNEAELERTVVRLRNNQILKGMIMGGGILFLGIVLGAISKRQRRRSSLL